TALSGFADTILVMKRHADGTRTLETIQRTGTDLPESVVTLDATTGEVVLGGSLDERRVAAAVEEVVRVVGPEVRTEQAIRDALSEARAAGLVVGIQGGSLVVRGPLRHAPLAQAVLAAKAEVMSQLAAEAEHDGAVPAGDGLSPATYERCRPPVGAPHGHTCPDCGAMWGCDFADCPILGEADRSGTLCVDCWPRERSARLAGLPHDAVEHE